MPVRLEDPFRAGKRGDQHEQRGLWQVKVREHRVGHSEAVPGQDKEIGLTVKGFEFARPRRTF